MFLLEETKHLYLNSYINNTILNMRGAISCKYNVRFRGGVLWFNSGWYY